MKISTGGNLESRGYFIRLFVAGDELNSKMAKDNLQKFCGTHIDGPCEIEVVDVLESYTTALENNIFITPALVIVAPEPAVTIFGDLSDTGELAKALRLGTLNDG